MTSHEIIGKVLDRWANDPTFRAEMKKDAEKAMRAAGIMLSAEELAALKRIDWSQSDEQLRARVSKGM